MTQQQSGAEIARRSWAMSVAIKSLRMARNIATPPMHGPASVRRRESMPRPLADPGGLVGPACLEDQFFARPCQSSGWWSGRGSNPRPSHCERDALPTELPPHTRRAILEYLPRRSKFGRHRPRSPGRLAPHLAALLSLSHGSAAAGPVSQRPPGTRPSGRLPPLGCAAPAGAGRPMQSGTGGDPAGASAH